MPVSQRWEFNRLRIFRGEKWFISPITIFLWPLLKGISEAILAHGARCAVNWPVMSYKSGFSGVFLLVYYREVYADLIGK